MGLVSLITRQADIIEILIYLLSIFVVLFLTLPVHEWAHAFAASKLGDPTPRYQGRLTLSPLAHIHPVGAFCMVLFGFGWGRPVQINSRNFDNPKRDMALSALAGPASNIIMAFIALVITNGVLLGATLAGSYSDIILYVCMFTNYVASVNIYLAVFNLIPVPPLDGSRLLTAFLPDRIYYRIMQYERYIIIGVIALIYIGVLDLPLAFLSNKIFSGLDYLASLPAELIFNVIK